MLRMLLTRKCLPQTEKVIQNYCPGQKNSGASNSARTTGANNNTVYIYIFKYIYGHFYSDLHYKR